jgi:hypothetical protein
VTENDWRRFEIGEVVTGTTTTFEVLNRSPGQIPLWPLDPVFQAGPFDNGVSENEWRVRKDRYPRGGPPARHDPAHPAPPECTETNRSAALLVPTPSAHLSTRD